VAFVGIELERSALTGKKKEEVIVRLMGMPEVLEIYETLEPFDLMLKLRTNNVDVLREIIGNISGISGVLNTNTILTTKKILETPLKYDAVDQKADKTSFRGAANGCRRTTSRGSTPL